MITTSPLRAAVAIRIAAAALAFGGAATSGAYVATAHPFSLAFSSQSAALHASQAARARVTHAASGLTRHHRRMHLRAWHAPRVPKVTHAAPKVIWVSPPVTTAAAATTTVSPPPTTSPPAGTHEPGDNGTEAGDG